MSKYLQKIKCPDGIHVCVIEDDGKVAYAYLIAHDVIISDVWLYNQVPSPTEPEWKDLTKAPFANLSTLVNQPLMASPLLSEDDVSVLWDSNSQGFLQGVDIFIRDLRYAVLKPTAKPGWCIAALNDGPLALLLE